MKRREFLTVPVKSLGGLLLYTISGEPLRVAAQESGKVRIPLLYLTEAEARAVQAACARILPSDESGPGATEANVIVYIDRQLAGPWARINTGIRKVPGCESVASMGTRAKEIRSRSTAPGYRSSEMTLRVRSWRSRITDLEPSRRHCSFVCSGHMPLKGCFRIRCMAGMPD